ncbi:MAG TPA: hypothetical protein GXZ31_07130 [Thermoanaerobacterales bacterium]|nr:hypothetical protein [Thermoanaerobacterales bacterium]
MVLADWVIIFIIGLNIIDGLRKGFITAFFGLLSVLGSIFAAMYYHKDISALLNKRLLLNQKIKELLAEKLTFLPGTQGLPGITDPPPSNNILEVFKGTWYHFLIKEPGDLILGSLDIITPLADFFVNIISFFMLFIAAKLVLSAANIIFNKLVKTGGLSGLNKTLGIIFGGIKGIIIIMLIITFMIPFLSVNPTGFLNTAFNSSVLAKYFYLYNFIPPFLAGFTI